MPNKVVPAAHNWLTNGLMINDVAKLGYLRRDWLTLDPTWGMGRWWTVFRPDKLVAHDLYTLDGVDFRDLPHPDGMFRAVAYDAPYKLSGTPTPADESPIDAQYGITEPVKWQERHALIRAGMDECARVLERKGYLLMKCQDQVCSGEVRWQTDEFTRHAEGLGLKKVDRFDLLTGGRTQPPRKRADGKPSVQQHARRGHSTLLVFRKP